MVFLETVELLTKSALLCYLTEYNRGVIECLNNIIRCCNNAQDFGILTSSYHMLCSCYIQFKDYDLAIACLEKFKDVAEDCNNYKEVIFIYLNLAKCYQNKKQSQQALYCYQQMLLHTWITNDPIQEIKCYDLLSLQYFNISDMKNSKYYNDRAIR